MIYVFQLLIKVCFSLRVDLVNAFLVLSFLFHKSLLFSCNYLIYSSFSVIKATTRRFLCDKTLRIRLLIKQTSFRIYSSMSIFFTDTSKVIRRFLKAIILCRSWTCLRNRFNNFCFWLNIKLLLSSIWDASLVFWTKSSKSKVFHLALNLTSLIVLLVCNSFLFLIFKGL